MNSMSQSLWQIGRPDLNAFLFCFVVFCSCCFCFCFVLFLFLFCFGFFFPVSSRRVRFELVTALFSMKYGTWFLNEQDTRQNTVEVVCCSKCSIVSFISFHVYFDKQVHKNMKKKLILLNQTHTIKQMRATALRHKIYFFGLIFIIFFLSVDSFEITHFKVIFNYGCSTP